MLYVLNADHSLGNEERVIGSLVAFFRAVMEGKELPGIEPTLELGLDGAKLTVEVSREPVEAQLWYAQSDVHDFCEASWEGRPLEETGSIFSAAVPKLPWCGVCSSRSSRSSLRDAGSISPTGPTSTPEGAVFSKRLAPGYNALRREGWNSYGKQVVVPMNAPTRG